MRILFPLCLTLFVLWAVLGQLNEMLAPLQIHLFAAGLFVVFAGEASLPRDFMPAAFFGGALFDAWSPAPFGTLAFIFAASAALLHALREHVPLETLGERVIAAATANAVIYAVYAAILARSAAGRASVPHLVSDLFFSGIFVALAGPWFLCLQKRTLDFFQRMLPQH